MKNINDKVKEGLINHWRPHYINVYSGINDKNWSPFLNHGYKNLDNSPIIKYDKEQLKWENQANLYTHLTEILKKYHKDFSQLDLLDTGCGFGHGTAVYKKYYNFKSVSGLDLNPDFIISARDNYTDIEFHVASATDMPFEDNSFDVITNIESLHNYKYTHHFYKEVYRVLKPGGYLLLTDPFIPFKDELISEDFFNRSGLYLSDKINITPMVINACKDDIQNFNSKHTNIAKEKVDNFISLAKEKLETYLKSDNYFLSYIYTKPIL